MLHDISWQPIFSFDENFDNFVEWERTDFKDFNNPRESPNGEIVTKKKVNCIKKYRYMEQILIKCKRNAQLLWLCFNLVCV